MSEPPITIKAAHSSAGPNQPTRRVVIHATSPGMSGRTASGAGMARNTAEYFASSSSGGSAHYIVDAGGFEEHCVADSRVAWHAPPNSYSIGIEICADSTYSRTDWLSPDVWPAVTTAAWRTAELCARLAVPTVRISAAELEAGAQGICSHADVAEAFGQSDHWDPGSGFPWDEFMALVTGTTTPEEDAVADTDVVAEFRVSKKAAYQLQRDGGVRVVTGDGAPLAGEPFHEYRILASDGCSYVFGPNRNGGVFSYPGLPAEARAGRRYFVAIGRP